MKKKNEIIDQDNALLNEVKGGIFEYLVALNISKLIFKESEFLYNQTKDIKNYYENLENLLQVKWPLLASKLIVLANKTSKSINLKNLDISEVVLVGKLQNKNYYEGDIILKKKNEKLDPIFLSLKLHKEHSFVNTKSAGLKSFLTSYFNSFKDITFWQSEFNNELEKSFLTLKDQLYHEYDILPDEDHSFENWQIRGFSFLPGKLPAKAKEYLLSHYNRLVNELARIVTKLYEIDPKKLALSLISLMGFSSLNILQVICYHKDHEITGNIVINEYKDIYNILLNSSPKMVISNSYIEFQYQGFSLQLRIKPMNRFTDLSYKLNCSVKYY